MDLSRASNPVAVFEPATTVWTELIQGDALALEVGLHQRVFTLLQPLPDPVH